MDTPSSHQTDFHLKVKVTDVNGREYFRAGDLERKSGQITGVINNEPSIVRSVRNGQRIEIPAADISDWMYFESGKMKGNFTVRPLMKHMSPGELQQVRQLFGE